MNSTDCKILHLLQTDGRKSYDKIGKAVGLSISAVNERIKKMQKQGIILGWNINVCPKKIGLDVLAFVLILLGKDEAPFLTEIAKIPEILECHHVTGEWSYILKVRTNTISNFELLLGKKIKKLPGILRTHTLIALSSPLERTTLPLNISNFTPKK